MDGRGRDDDPFVWEDGIAAPEAGVDVLEAPTPGRRRGTSGRDRRRTSAGAALAALLLGFFLGGLLDARNLQSDARALPLGAKRTLLIWLVAPAAAVSEGLRLDHAAFAVDRLLGRADTVPHRDLNDLKAGKKPVWPRTVTARRPLELYVAGDSMAGQFGGPFIELAEKTGLIDGRLDYHVSTGLSRPDYFDWPQRLIDMIYRTRAEGTVFLVGGNDAQSVESGGRVLKFGTEEWLALYHQRVAAAMDIATEGGRRVYWVGQPNMRDPAYAERMRLLDAVYADEAARHPGVTYVDTWKLFSKPDGSYGDYLGDAGGDLVRMRQTDGIHLTRAGADRMADRVLEVVRSDWKLP